MSRDPGFDYLIVGAGFAGSVLAERLAAERGERVLLIDQRPHIGGNAYDECDDDGLLIHRYGPHIFHTNSAQIFDLPLAVHRVAALRAPRAGPGRRPAGADPDQPRHDQPALRSRARAATGWRLPRRPGGSRSPRSAPRRTSSSAAVGRELYEKFFRGYTRKQWGVDPSELDKSVTARVPTRTDRDDRYFTDTFQCMPLHGYTRMFERMLDHPNIKVMLQTRTISEVRDEIRVQAHDLHRTDRRVSSTTASASCPTARCVSST